MVTHSSILAYRIPWTEKSGRLQFTGSPRVGHDSATSLSLSFTLQENFPKKKELNLHVQSVYQFSSVAQSCPTFCDPMKCSTPGLPVHHQLPEFTQTHIHRVSDAIQPSHPLSSPSPPAPNPFQHQGLSQ